MRSIIFIPGILGSRLDLSGEEVWPPDLWEHLSYYKRIDKLLNANVRACVFELNGEQLAAFEKPFFPRNSPSCL